VKRHRAALALAVGLAASGCARSARQASSAPSCPAGWTAQASSDSLIGLCMPAGFDPGRTSIGGSYVWKRPASNPGDSDWVAVALVADSTRYAAWPPALESPGDCRADCYTVDSAMVHSDTMSRTPARLETGLVSGGNEAARRAPRLVGGWITPRRTRILVVGAAGLGATLDTLRTALRTLQVRVP